MNISNKFCLRFTYGPMDLNWSHLWCFFPTHPTLGKGSHVAHIESEMVRVILDTVNEGWRVKRSIWLKKKSIMSCLLPNQNIKGFWFIQGQLRLHWVYLGPTNSLTEKQIQCLFNLSEATFLVIVTFHLFRGTGMTPWSRFPWWWRSWPISISGFVETTRQMGQTFCFKTSGLWSGNISYLLFSKLKLCRGHSVYLHIYIYI